MRDPLGSRAGHTNEDNEKALVLFTIPGPFWDTISGLLPEVEGGLSDGLSSESETRG